MNTTSQPLTRVLQLSSSCRSLCEPAEHLVPLRFFSVPNRDAALLLCNVAHQITLGIEEVLHTLPGRLGQPQHGCVGSKCHQFGQPLGEFAQGTELRIKARAGA